MPIGIGVGGRGKVGLGRALVSDTPYLTPLGRHDGRGSGLIRAVPYALNEGSAGGGLGLQDDMRFAIEWNTTTGLSEAAIRDTGRVRPFRATTGNALTGTPQGFEVFNTASQGRDYPTTNFARCSFNRSSDSSGYAFLTTGGTLGNGTDPSGYIPTLQIGWRVALRYYFRNLLTSAMSAADSTTHGCEWTEINGVPVFPYGATEFSAASTYAMGVYPQGSPADPFVEWYTNGGWSAVSGAPTSYPMSKNVTYRIEHLMTRLTSTTYTLEIRIYNASGTILLWETPDFTSQNGGALNQTLTGNSNHWNNIVDFHIGLNSLIGYGGAVGSCFEFAALAIACGPNATWLGPYRAAEASFTTP